jgi:hypothetical protein
MCRTLDPEPPCAVAKPSRGGRGPVQQGAAGVDATASEIESAGGTILAREVTIETGGVRTRPDLYVELPSGERAFVEVKTGPSAGPTRNQETALPVISSTGGTIRARNAQDVGLIPGRQLGPTRVIVVHRP